jgi:hypothetical protein
MAKVFLSITSYNSVSYSEEKVELRNLRKVPLQMNY